MRAIWLTVLILGYSLAWAEPSSFPAGIWQGSLGKQPITACFAFGSGSYYYQRYLAFIPLSAGEGGEDLVLKEADGIWHIAAAGPDRLRGTWSSPDGSRTLPILLKKKLLAKVDGEEPGCGSDAYNKPIESAPRVVAGEVKSVGALKYRELSVSITAAAQDNDDHGLSLATVEVLDDSAGIRAVNRSLRHLIDPNPLFECRRQQLEYSGARGWLESSVVHLAAQRRWLTVGVSTSQDCGGAHWSTWDFFQTWNLETGQPENLLTWFKDADASQFNAQSGANGSLPEPLAEFVGERIGQGDPSMHLTHDDYVGCYGEGDPGGQEYMLRLNADGVDFILPTTWNGSCGDVFSFTFKELEPFLSKAGRAAAAQFKQAGSPG